MAQDQSPLSTLYHQPPAMDTGAKKVEKRNRPPLSCEPCRSRKLKCNRGLPCDTCGKRGISASCLYAPNATRNKAAVSKPSELKDRLNVLENLISSLISGEKVIQPSAAGSEQPRESLNKDITTSSQANGVGSQGTTRNDLKRGEESLTPETPRLRETGDGQLNYIEPSHWLSILDDIKEVREHLSVPTRTLPQNETARVPRREARQTHGAGEDIQGTDMATILSSLPSQPICDMLLAWYFETRFLILGIIHPAKFQNEYAAFWESPLTTSPLWIGLLFSILAVTTSLRQMSNIVEAEGSVPPLQVLQRRALQCLEIGRYSTANEYALEAFVLHLQSCFGQADHLPVDLWFEMGTIIRLAIRMGYHRDPSHLNGISPFDGEMRRRVWLNIFQVDALMSFQMGFPSMISADFCDAKVPRNLEYSDLAVEMKELPPSRPPTDNTPVLYIIVKASVMGVFKKITAHTQSLSPPTYESTLALDIEMRSSYESVPELLQRRDVNRSFIDHSCLIWQRCAIEVLYLRGIIVLHRRYISYEVQTSKYDYSRRACVEAALEILARQADLHQASGPGGRLHGENWIMFALPVNDFLLAAMVLCLDLSVRMRSRVPSGRDSDPQLTAREHQALHVALNIWTEISSVSPEAHVAALAVDLMLKKGAENQADTPRETGVAATDTNGNGHLPYVSMMSQVMDGSEDFDWALLDHYLQNMDTMVPDIVG